MPAEHSFWFANLLNRLFGGWVTALLTRIHVPPANAAHPIPKYVAEEVLVMLILIVTAIILRSLLSVEKPGRFQLAAEFVFEFTRNMTDEVIGKEGRRYIALIGSLGIFICLCNLLGLIPTLDTPTAHVEVPLGCALLVFLHYNLQGIRHHGIFGYLKHLAGPMAAIAVLMFPVEVFSNLLRMLSLTVRLYANMRAGILVEGIFTGLVPIVVPSIFMALHIFESLLQAYIFMILPALYIALAVQEEH
ncbi:MAG TPA: F0F1 ATP synthase subunit A [Terriglobia bacterium]|nr:F0F1 ATP synthase subunit A [Terriglobia bacterium]